MIQLCCPRWLSLCVYVFPLRVCAVSPAPPDVCYLFDFMWVFFGPEVFFLLKLPLQSVYVSFVP